MSEINIKLLDLINKGYTINEIGNELNLSFDQLNKMFRELKLIGMDFNKKYYSSGDIIYFPRKEIDLPGKKNSVNIITNHQADTFRAMLISDLHAGSEYENIDAWNRIYDYCTINGIHIIIIAGDFLDGIKIGRAESKKHNNCLEQIEYSLKNYPFDKNILNFTVLGNHDIDSLSNFGVDFSEYLRNFRYDIVPVGYGNGTINIKNDRILVAHPLCIGVSYNHNLTSNFLLIKGHQHASRSIIGNNGNCSLVVPSLSNLFLTENVFMPGAMDLIIKFKGGYFDEVYYEQLMLGDKIYVVNSTQIAVGHPRDRKFDLPIKYEEDLTKRKILKK